MARVTRRPLAVADIFDIWDHIAEDSLERADRWIDKLDEKFSLIATQPLMGRARHELAAADVANPVAPLGVGFRAVTSSPRPALARRRGEVRLAVGAPCQIEHRQGDQQPGDAARDHGEHHASPGCEVIQ